MSYFTATWFMDAQSVVASSTDVCSTLRFFPDGRNGGEVTLQLASSLPIDEQVQVAERILTEVTRWRDELATAAKRAEETARRKAERLTDGSRTAGEWNARYPVGTAVVAYPVTRDDEPLRTVTRTPAWTLGHGAPVVSVEGCSGGIRLTHIDVIKDGTA
ncbi:hypothetical protein [Streptomyces filamentosus]|uniref:hypothetical protein n=1 Tax=Streptomyces filamentosus TaxID=67294 RepID=UPI0037D27336